MKNKPVKGSKEEKWMSEWERNKKNEPDWLDDDGEVFICKLCRKFRPDKLKSKTKIGLCSLCTGGK